MSEIGWHPHPETWLIVTALLGGYFYAVKKIGPRRVSLLEVPASRRQITAFTLGIVAFWLASDWPLHELSDHYLYSAHMVQHLLLTLVAPPLLLVGTPPWLLRALLPRPLLTMIRAIARPLPALLLFNGVLVATHWPDLVDLMLGNQAVHLLAHGALFGSALLMWTPVLSPIIEIPRLSYPGRMFYLFLQSIVPTVPASFLTFADSVIYGFYAEAPRLLPVSALTDQMIAGLMMKIGGGFILWLIIAVMFFRWHALEEASGLDTLTWRDVDRELNRVSPTKE